jgi:molecular chaperone GrpE
MSDGRRSGSEHDETVKVVDRRRFRPDGAPVEEQAEAQSSAESGEAPAAQASGPDSAPPPEDPRVVQQAARIDELTRAYASLIEENKAFRSRLEREKDRALEAERLRIAQALLEAIDEVERTLSAANGALKDAAGSTLETLIEGVRLTLATLTKRAGEMGATRFSVMGERFDPRTAEAIDVIPVADATQDELVLQEVRPGYRIGERILRPARVRVGRLARA